MNGSVDIIKRNYKYYDPVALIYKKSRLPFFWGQQESFKPMKKAERAVMHEARLSVYLKAMPFPQQVRE